MSQAVDEPSAKPAPLRSVHTTSLPQILNQLGSSLAVTTYQAGKLVLLRPELREKEKDLVLNTHFRGSQIGLCRFCATARRRIRSANGSYHG
jgi:hypothetical protein